MRFSIDSIIILYLVSNYFDISSIKTKKLLDIFHNYQLIRVKHYIFCVLIDSSLNLIFQNLIEEK